jgi:hypothetical protein
VARHHATQQRGRGEVFQDYHLRVGEVVLDTAPPAGVPIVEQRLDETEVGPAKFVTLTEVQPTSSEAQAASAATLLDPPVVRSQRQRPDRLRCLRQHLQRGKIGAPGIVAPSAIG